MLRNIKSAQRVASLISFNPSPILTLLQLKTPPFTSFINKDRVQVNITIGLDLSIKINKVVKKLLD